jgi:hypothetical protein
MLLAVVVIAVGIIFGGKWWRLVDSAYLKYMYKPIGLNAAVRAEGSSRVLRLSMNNVEWLDRDLGDLIPDHGKLLHPVRTDADTFEVTLPPIPEGRYKIYADVVHRNGLTETLTAGAEMPPPSTIQQAHAPIDSTADADDSWLVGSDASEAEQRLADGSTMIWERDLNAPLIAERLESLRFFVRAPGGEPSTLEPYMGMRGHAVVMRDDGAVFVHVHPVGTVSMASQQAFAERVIAGGSDKGETGDKAADQIAEGKYANAGPEQKSGLNHSSHVGAADHSRHQVAPGSSMSATSNAQGMVSFPYSFPKPGSYRVWVQVKRGGRVLTGVYSVNVL